MEEDSSRTISYQDASKSSTEENIRPNPALPSPSRSPSADNLFTSLPAPANVVGASRTHNSQDSADSGLGMEISVLQPPQVGGGKPMNFKRGPGRPRKDGAGKSPKPVVSQKIKKLTGLLMPTGGRGIRGRKKMDGGPFVGGTNSVSGTLGDLNVINHESPPRFLMTEDTAESDTSSVASSFEKLNEDFTLFPEQWPGKLCALCNLGERSMLGQGELIRLEIPIGFDPQSVSRGLSISSKNEKDNSSDRSPKPNFSSRRSKGVKIKRLTSQGSLESMNEPVDEVVGFAEEPDLNNIFDASTGYYYVHVSCALWCDDVLRLEDGTFKNLEKEIVRALSQHCSHCGNLGAGIACKAPGCGCSLHFACAATSGGFQESSSRTTLCISHTDLAVAMLGKAANCTVCDQPGSISSLLMCCSCNNHYHSACLALNSDPTIRAGWQCPACKICQACRQPGEDTKLLPCDACDKVYHIFCLRPALTSCPKYSWKCKMCRICTDCGARTPGSGPSSRWHANFSVCDSCYQQRNKGLACPCCGKAYRHVAQKHMVQCNQCKKYVHDTCDPAADLNIYHVKKEQNPDYEYTCIVCLSAPTGAPNSTSAHPRVLLSLKRSSDKDELSSESSSLFNSFTPSQDSFLSPEDDSLPGVECSTDLSWVDKNSSVLLDEIRPPITSAGRGKPLTGNFSKKKLGVGRPRTHLDKHGALNSANNRRQGFNEFQRKRGPKPKMRGVFGAPGVGLQRPSADVSVKSEDEPGVENRLVLCSSRDEFVLQQDVCVMCGAFGNDLEGRLISCAQCGQCYHPFCVHVKVTKVVLQKGWRCLDCTVCEGCGQRHDEARLLLCDDCDISFHIYCMDPPLEYVPEGNWKCKWCVVCQLCGSNDPGLNSTWHNNYTLCGPCSSLNSCPVCKGEYTEGELIIQCTRCDRWLHASCDMINNENEAEKCADEDYQCVLCRPSDMLPPHLQPPPPPVITKVISPPRSPEPKSRPLQHFLVDGINLSEMGMSHLKSLSMEQPKKKRKKMSNIADMEAGILAAIESVVSGSSYDPRADSIDTDRADEASEKDKESAKKKQRNLQKLGIGGFFVRMRGPRFKDDDEPENQSSQDGEKPKRKQARKKVKNKIVESFPSYLQEAFFGKTLLDPCKDSDFISGDENDMSVSSWISPENYVKLSADELKAIEATRAKQENSEKGKSVSTGSVKTPDPQLAQNEPKEQLKQQIKMEEEEADDTLQHILPSDLLDNDLVNTIMNEGDDMKVGEGLEDLSVVYAGVESTLGDDGELSLDHNGGDANHKDELTDFLSSQFNLESIDTGLPSMDSKDVEDIFKGVLTDESQESQDNLFPISSGPPLPPPHSGNNSVQSNPNPSSQLISQQSNINASVVISTPGVQGSPGLPNRSQLQQNVQQGLASPISFPPPSPYHSEYSNSPQFSPAFSEPPSPWPSQVESEQETPSNYSQRSILKWEADEALGLSATISAVLYANTNHPELKRDLPNWAERSKQIAKIWRGLSTEKRAPYLQKARENRAASRMQKSQQIPKESKSGGGTPSKVALNSSQSQSPDTDAQMKLSPSSSSSCSASGSLSSSDVISSINLESSGSSQLSISGAGFTPCTNISSSTLTSTAPTSGHTTVSSCMMSSNVVTGNNNTSNLHIHLPTSHSKVSNNASSTCSSPSAITSAFTSSSSLAQKDSNPFTSSSTPKFEVKNNRCPVGDQQIRVLTPSEIMRTLPTLSHESCSFNSSLDQDKIVNGPLPKQVVRGETTEERHWKQMQVFRQQQQQQQQIVLQEHRLQGEPSKEHLGGGSANMNLNPSPKLQYSAAMAQVQRQLGGEPTHGSANSDPSRQPLQVTTSHEMSMPGPQSSPHLQSPNSRPGFATNMQSNRPRPPALDMPPPSPSPHYSPRPVMSSQGSPTVRQPMYSRVPYMHSPRQQITSPGDPYANSPMTPQPVNDPYAHPPSTPRPSIPENENFPVTSEPYQKIMTDSFTSSNNSNNDMDMSGGLSSPRSQAPQGQETRQHLRDLLQRQQFKKMEQEQMSPGCTDISSPGTPRSMTWSQDDWQKGASIDPNFSQRHQLSNPSSPQMNQQQNQFRHPFLPLHGRLSNQAPQKPMQVINRQVVPEYKTGQPNSQQQQPVQSVDSRVRLLLQQQQQQRLMVPQQQVGNRPQLNFTMGQQQVQQMQQQQMQQQQLNSQAQFRQGMPNRNPLDPYDHLVGQQRQGVVISPDGNPSQGSSMLAQQLGRPLNSVMNSPQIPIASPPPVPQPNTTSHMSPSRNSGGKHGAMQGNHGVISATPADHQELPDSVTAELEKLEQEQHNEAGVETETGELVDMGIDDDELLGMGADFNILEYADPELDQAVGGEKTNILDNLDLEEEKEEEKDENKDLKRKEIERHGKREPGTPNYSSLGTPIQGNANAVMPKIENVPVSPSPVGIPNSQPGYAQHQTGMNQHQSNVGDPMLRPPQPPPPYPVPPPPYPGRPQMGIRNGGGMSMQSMPSMMNIGIGLKNAQMGMVGNSGLRPASHHLPSAPLSSSCNPVMSAHQRRTLLLQEQPLLLEDLLEQEKREQQRQGPGLMGAAPEEPLLSDFDFERLKADVLSSSNLPVSLSPPTLQGQVILPPPAQPGKFNRAIPQINQPTGSDWQVESDNVIVNRRNLNQNVEHSPIPLHPALAQSSGSNLPAPPNRVSSFPMPSLPAPPTPPEHPTTEQDRQMQIQYEQWLYHQQNILSTQLKYFEGEVTKLRKGKKSLNSKQRQLRKNGGELIETDAAELERITRELTGLQKQLDQSRKQSRQHGLSIQDYRSKQQKRQQMMGGNAVQQQQQTPNQASPLGPASHSPLHSTPQSPILSPSPSMGGPVSSPLMQHSPMASPLTPSPGPVPSSLSQTSPRSSVGIHHMDDRPFSPNNENSMRSLASPQGNQTIQNRMAPQQSNPQLRMGSPIGGNQSGNMQPGQLITPNMNQNIMIARGSMNVNMNTMHQQRPMAYIDNQRMRHSVPPDQMRMIGPGGQRFPRVGMSQDLMLRARNHQNQYQNPNQPQIIMSPGGQQHYASPQRVPFPNQSPTGPNPLGVGMVTNLRSPLPMNTMGGLGSPPGSQVMMTQNRVSPASSPMRRPSGSGSVGVASPLPDRPQSVENPLTPRSTGSGPHTPSSISGGLGCSGMEGLPGQHSSADSVHFHSMDASVVQQDNLGSQGMQNYNIFPPNSGQSQHSDYGGGGGGGNSQVIPFPTFSWFGGPNKLGLRGGNPFSVVNGNPSSHSSNIIPEQNEVAVENNINTEGFSSANHVSNTSESSTVSVAITNNEHLPTPVVPVDPLDRGSSHGHSTVNIKEIKLEAVDPLETLPSVSKSEESPISNSMMFFTPCSGAQSVAVPVSIEQGNLLLNAIRNSTETVDMEALSSVDPGASKEPLDIKPNIDPESVGDMKKLVMLPKAGMQYLVTGVNNVIGLATTNFQGATTQTMVDINSQHVLSTSGSVVELPASSIHQANMGVLSGFRSAKSQSVISQIFEPNRLVPIQTIQSMDPSKLQNVSHVQGTPVSLASFVADAVHAASLPFPQVSKSVTQGTLINSSGPLITVYSRPEMRSVQGNHPTNLTAVLLTSPRLTTSVTGQQQGLAVATKVTQPGESQNALLKQLLQNTGCASMNQAPTDTGGFSLTSFAKTRPSASVPIHTSQLSEAASRIPQPTPPPMIRPQVPNCAIQPTQVRMPIKIEVRATESQVVQQQQAPMSVLPPKPPPTPPQPVPVKSPRIVEESPKPVTVEEVVNSEPPTESSNSSVKDVIEVVATDKNSSETTVTESKKADEEVKKGKRRQYQPKKKETSTPKKRMRKGSKLEEDYDSYMETLITQVRQLPPVNIMEPELGRNYNVCSIFGAGDYSKINIKGYSLIQGELFGEFGDTCVNNESDYYNTRPFGPDSPTQSSKSQPPHRGFYHQEFGAPKLGSGGNKYSSNNRSPTPFRETDTPDTIVSSSSPECVMENFNMYPGLKLIDEDDDERQMYLRDSPVIPIFAPIPIRPVHAEQLPKPPVDDIDKENINVIPETFVMKARQASGAVSPLKESGNVTVTLTLSSNVAEDIGGVLRNLANVLSISAPQIYQVVERTITPPSQKLGVYTYKGKDGKEIVDIQSILNGTAKFCRHCDVVVLNNVIRKKFRDLPGIVPDDTVDESDELYFCSTTCFMQYAMTHGVNLPAEEKAGAVVKHPSEKGEGVVKSEASKLPVKDSRLTLYDPEIMKSIKEKSNSVVKTGPEPTTLEARENKLKRPNPGEVKVKEEGETPGKKWKGVKYKKWFPGRLSNQPSKYKKPTEKEMTEMLFRMRITVAPLKIPDDARKCKFCHQIGDGVSDGPGRLLNYDVDKWVHLNCALWSEEVYETENGALMNVELALKQSLVLTCIACKQKGATVKCFKTRCSSVHHLGCAVKEGCVFYKNKTVYCSVHVPKGEKDNELTTLSVFRRVYIQRDENRQVAAVMHHADQHHLLRVGSLVFLSVGQLLPHQLQNFHTINCIYPIGYKIVRFYWSMKRTNKRCQYICSIHEVEGKPEFRITPQEEGTKEVVIKSASAQGAWHQVLDSIAKLRNSCNTIKVFPKYITGEDLFGLTEPAIVRVLESLPGIETLTDYNFKYGRNPLLELPLAINPTGCARSEPKLRTHFKRPHTQRTGSSSRASSAIATASVLSSSEAVCPYSKQFVHSKSSQYKKMKQDWRNNVYLARSKIQGLGLYAARDIEKHTMVIEYIGEIIRSELAELREKKYEAQNRGIYMFRVDEDRVIDATLSGGLARYINHSCNPNCVAETVEVDREWRIIIFANRRISRGEELAYDYKFEFEDDQHKIQCFCGAPNCRQWMN